VLYAVFEASETPDRDGGRLDDRGATVDKLEKHYTLRELEKIVHPTPWTLRDRIKEGRLTAVMRYKGGNRDDPRSYRYLVPESAVMAFVKAELLSSLKAWPPRWPGWDRRDKKGRLLSPVGS
jgi:hypothetical protein